MTPTPEAAISIREMRVDYGSFTAVHGLDLEIFPGQIFGLIGPNGAGKTSTFKVLATLLEPTYGEVRIAGHDIIEHTHRARQRMGYMQDLAPLPTDLQVWEFMDCFAHAYGLSKAERQRRIQACLELVDLQEKRVELCKSLSRGMTQRLVLAKCLVHEPSVLLLDEPASGMDPISRVRLRDTIQTLSQRGVAVLISSHILSELSDVCTHVGILHRGQLVDHGRTQEVIERHIQGESGRLLRIKTLEDCPALVSFLDDNPLTEIVERDEATVSIRFSGSREEQVELMRSALQADWQIYSFEEVVADIEDVILKLHTPTES